MAIDSNNLLTEDQADYFEELINIAYGRAAGLLNDFTGEEVKLHIPKVQFETYAEFVQDVADNLGDETIVSKQTFNGQISGETMMVIDRVPAENMARLINGTDTVNDQQVLSAVYEIGNIITTSTKTLSDLAKVPLVFNSPSTKFQHKNNLMEKIGQNDYSNVISITTYLDIPNASIHSKIYYLFRQESVTVLSAALTI